MTLFAAVCHAKFPPVRVSYLTALDIWLIVCVLFALAAFVIQLISVALARRAAATDSSDDNHKNGYSTRV
jgi:hypothetical protein